MYIKSIRLTNIRCFEDTKYVEFSKGCNLLVGQNNAGKSTILRSVLAWQNFQLSPGDVRARARNASNEMILDAITGTDNVNPRPSNSPIGRYTLDLRGKIERSSHIPTMSTNGTVFYPKWPDNFIVPFVAKRKALNFDQSVTQNIQSQVTGTFANLYSRIDLLATSGRSAHDNFRRAVNEIVGLPITTKSSEHGKEAGFYFDDDNFVTLDRMGDGVSEMVALIVELCLATGKLFVLEEPETNLHPRGLKALLGMVRESALSNQFMIATHSNIVVRELAADSNTKVFRVYRDNETPSSESKVEEVEQTPSAHMALLNELGYEFADFSLHDGWLFLEESSAETVIREILMPWFVPQLIGRLRTFAVGGVSNVEPAVSEFQRLVTFVHLQPVYENRLWVRADGDDPGKQTVAHLKAKFAHLAGDRAATFSQPQFEHFYPERFREKAHAALGAKGKQERRSAKASLLKEVLGWTFNNEAEARSEWGVSAGEQIALLETIAEQIGR